MLTKVFVSDVSVMFEIGTVLRHNKILKRQCERNYFVVVNLELSWSWGLHTHSLTI